MPGPLHFNGIDYTTGDYLVAPTLPAGLVAQIRGEPDELHLLELQDRHAQREPHLGVRRGVDVRELAEAGWGVLCAPGAQPILDALRPLLDLRRSQANARKPLYRELVYEPGETKLDFQIRHGAAPGNVDPAILPYYILIVGDPEIIPFSFQFELDVQHAVGRLAFDDLEDYAAYARSVVKAESVRRAPRATFFAPVNYGDPATEASAANLVAPLAGRAAERWSGWDVEHLRAASATRERLATILGAAEAPALLFTAAHGLGFPSGHPLQRAHQGALLCQDWPGLDERGRPRRPGREHYFAGEDLEPGASFLGLVAFQFACFGGGTPRFAEHAPPGTPAGPPLAPSAFVSRLPQRLLAHPGGGALAVVAHVDRTWGCSFTWPGGNGQLAVFEDALDLLVEGYPVGAALESFNQRYAELSTYLTPLLAQLAGGVNRGSEELAFLWTACHDARSYTILGDPAARLSVGDPRGGDAPSAAR